ncbi:BQ5605_C003g02472 [Microbotryum silenes-dioicae]|uniref:BQ5605_C003g02472 protein n=1 Tax=Microbotryum silenes-dioicae TaxID=796604 RepID=A0A2X0M628_9BASI|nr:BQ5605_C003g02472 [Microbotryum silenes-dioicae]
MMESRDDVEETERVCAFLAIVLGWGNMVMGAVSWVVLIAAEVIGAVASLVELSRRSTELAPGESVNFFSVRLANDVPVVATESNGGGTSPEAEFKIGAVRDSPARAGFVASAGGEGASTNTSGDLVAVVLEGSPTSATACSTMVFSRSRLRARASTEGTCSDEPDRGLDGKFNFEVFTGEVEGEAASAVATEEERLFPNHVLRLSKAVIVGGLEAVASFAADLFSRQDARLNDERLVDDELVPSFSRVPSFSKADISSGLESPSLDRLLQGRIRVVDADSSSPVAEVVASWAPFFPPTVGTVSIKLGSASAFSDCPTTGASAGAGSDKSGSLRSA